MQLTNSIAGMTREQWLAYRKLMLSDPWLFAGGVANLTEKFIERFHRPLLYLMTGEVALLCAALNAFDSEPVRQIKKELRRLNLDWNNQDHYARIKANLHRVNVRISRSMGKTTLATIAVLFIATKDPNETIGIASKSQPAAEAFCILIGNIMLGDAYRFFFPERLAPTNPEKYVNKDAIWVWGRTDPTQNTIEARGINSQWTSKHYSRIVGDDLVGTESGEASNDDALRWIAAIPGISRSEILGGTTVMFVGTVYGPNDDHSVISRDWNTITLVVPIWVKEHGGIAHIMEDGVPTLPEWYDVQAIRKIRATVINDRRYGHISFLQNFELTAHESGIAIFTEGMISATKFRWVFSDAGVRIGVARPKKPGSTDMTAPVNDKEWYIFYLSSLRVTLGIDQAFSESGDQWALAAIGWDHLGVCYLLDVIVGNGYPKMLSAMPIFWARWGYPHRIGMDSNATQGMTHEWMQRTSEMRRMASCVVPYRSTKLHKDQGIYNYVAARLETQELWTAPDIPHWDKEALDYRRDDKHAVDNALDATAIAVATSLGGASVSPEEERRSRERAERARERFSDSYTGLPSDAIGWLTF